MSTKPTTKKPTKKKTQPYVELDDILDSIASSIDCIADKNNILTEAVASIAGRLEAAEELARHWRNTTICAIAIAVCALAVEIIK